MSFYFTQTEILIVKSPFGLRRIMPSFSILLSIAVFSMLTGCGQKGPLFLPPEGNQENAKPVVPAVTLPDSETSISR
ncbi:LPS translocon maturation chaperone LptM [Oxalicibacterium faecigallinarum]|uniref:LPS translocon maturation chaperone LptM n=1 Tax=Oxalicibacterium faecigallinarum TaxID=573741 RepID=UPI0016679E7E|nr:lipoprotein [Oxalicibacterium faecigallinarum]